MNVSFRSLRWAFALLLALPAAGRAEVVVDPMFGDHMVLQRGMAVPVYGKAAPGEAVTVKFRGQEKTAAAGADGRWILRLDPMEPGDPAVLEVSGKTAAAFQDVLVGEVWLGSGQSNMAGRMGAAGAADPGLAALLKGAPLKNLRICADRWQEGTEENLKKFSTLLFAFGASLQRELDVPVGLILRAQGGTAACPWLSREMLEGDEACRARLAADPSAPVRVGGLFEERIRPVIPYGIRGVLWDQGESGSGHRSIDWSVMTAALVRGWRKEWGQGDFPFLYIQKPSGGGCAHDPKDPVTALALPCSPPPRAPATDEEGAKREDFLRLMALPNAAMVTASDLGGGTHPRNKWGYGSRACRVALGFVYGRAVEIYGPVYCSHEIEGGTVRVRYARVGKGLDFRHAARLQGFELAGADGGFRAAEARIDGETVVVSSPGVPAPAAVRYAWGADISCANLFNKDGLPALTFRAPAAAARPPGER